MAASTAISSNQQMIIEAFQGLYGKEPHHESKPWGDQVFSVEDGSVSVTLNTYKGLVVEIKKR